jgi:signal transduction histidine kinase
MNAEIKYKTLFLSKVAHEFKNPLLCITELVDEIYEYYDEISESGSSKRLAGSKIKQNLQRVKSMSNYLFILIKDMDFFSMKCNDSVITLNKGAVILQNVLTFCMEVTNTLIKKFQKENRVSFILEHEALPNEIYIDELRLKQVLINLLSNSVKFTNNGFIKLKVV